MNLNLSPEKETVRFTLRYLWIGISAFLTVHSFAQNVGINASGASPNVSAMLDIASTSEGLLIPRVTLQSNTDATTIVNGNVTSLLVYNTTAAGAGSAAVYPGYYYWNGSKWVAFTGNGGNDWSLLGNTGITNPAVPATYGTSTFGATENWLGTIDSKDLVFGTNNTERMRIMQTTGNVGIGTAAPAAKLSFEDLVATSADGITWYNPAPLSYGIFKTAGAWSGPNYQQLSLAWQTGIVIDGGSLYGLSGTVLQPNGGNVGVGISTPSSLLHVKGAARLGLASTTTGSLIFNNASNANTATIQSGVTTSTYALTLPTAQGAASTVLTNDGAGNTSWKTVAAVGGNNMFSGFQVFQYTGSPQTFTLPAGVTRVMVEMWGGGGGGGASSGGTGYAGDGGGGGAYAKSLFTVASNLTINVGAGGSGGTSPGGNGNAGGTTSISGGAVLSAGGGSGGKGNDVNSLITSGGIPTATSASSLGINGYPGAGELGGATGGEGGASPAGGAGGQANGTPGNTGAIPGGGGGGASQTNAGGASAGGAGANGLVIIWW